MKWNKAKSILIVFFIIIDALLLAYITADKINSKKIEEEIADTAIEILSKNNISVDKKIITDAAKNKSLKPVYARNIVDDYSEFAKKVLGEGAHYKSKNCFASEIGKITFDGDYFEAERTASGALCNITEKSDDYEKIALQCLSSMGASVSNLKGITNRNNNEISVSFKKRINKLEVFGAGMRFDFDADGLKKISGNWYNEQAPGDDLLELKSPSGALIEYMNQRDNSRRTVISNISLGFASLESKTYHESILLTPVWAIIEDGGKEVYINAREK